MVRNVLNVSLLSLELLLILRVYIVHLQADPLDTWRWRNPLPQGNTLRSVTFGKGIFLAVGDHGTILLSGDGGAWESQSSGTSANLRSVAYGQNVFVAVGDYIILTSPDGTNWSSQSSFQFFNDVAFGNGLFVAVGRSGSIQKSSDGTNWVASNPRTNANFTCVAYGNATWVVLGDIWSPVLTSQDAITWSRRSPGASMYYFDLVFANGNFVSVGAEGPILTSSNGIAWTPRGSDGLFGVTRGNASFVAVGAGGVSMSSADGISWNATALGTQNTLLGVAYGNGVYVAVGDYGTIATSSDATGWLMRSSGFTEPLIAAAYGKGMYVALGAYADIFNSTDGSAWTVHATSRELDAVAFGNGRFVVVGGRESILTSTDGAEWTPRSWSSNGWLKVLTFGNGLFLAGGVSFANEAFLLVSSNGLVWKLQSLAPWVDIFDMACGKDRFVVLGQRAEGNAAFVSEDGMNWTDRLTGIYGLGAITFGNGLFLASTSTDQFATSTNGLIWEPRSSTNGLGRLIYAYGTFVSLGTSIDTSFDGLSWTRRNQLSAFDLRAVTYGRNEFIAVGNSGAVLQSGKLQPPAITGAAWSAQSQFQTTVCGEQGRLLVLQISSDLIHWEDLIRFVASGEGTNLIDRSPTNLGSRFYRVTSP